MVQYQTNLRIDQRDPFEFVDNIAKLRLIRFQEFTAGWYIKKQILDRKDTTLGTGIRLYILQGRSGDR